MVITGCLKREEQVAGRQPNPVERAGVMEDYIITNAAPATSAAAGSGSGAVGTSGTAASGSAASAGRNISSQYKVEGIPDERLSQLVGKRVEITGRVDDDDQREAAAPGGATAGGATAAAPAPDDDMPEFEAVSIREVAGTCDEGR
jgi:hypothetical protein